MKTKEAYSNLIHRNKYVRGEEKGLGLQDTIPVHSVGYERHPF